MNPDNIKVGNIYYLFYRAYDRPTIIKIIERSTNRLRWKPLREVYSTGSYTTIKRRIDIDGSSIDWFVKHAREIESQDNKLLAKLL